MAATCLLCFHQRLHKVFQSPCHRGDGCNAGRGKCPVRGGMDFQSPCHRGDGCNPADRPGRGHRQALSVPLSSGRWLQPPRMPGCGWPSLTFQSPCHRGDGCNTAPTWHQVENLLLSVPLSSGRWLQLEGQLWQIILDGYFQSPCHRGDGCNKPLYHIWGTVASFQSPCQC